MLQTLLVGVGDPSSNVTNSVSGVRDPSSNVTNSVSGGRGPLQ